MKFLRITDVMEKTGLARSTIWMMCKEDRFPKPIKLSERVTVWDCDLVEEWMKGISNECKL